MYIIIGASSFLGSYLIKNILLNTDEKIIASYINGSFNNINRIQWIHCDITNYKDIDNLYQYIKVNKYKKIKLIYLPAYFNVKKIYDTKLAWDINISSYAYFLGKLDKIDRFISISTDMLYSINRDIPYTENDEVSPLNDYAHHKYIQELMCKQKNYHIIRLPVMIGPSLSPYKKHFYDEIIDNFLQKKAMQFFTDSWRSIIDFDTVSKIIIKLINCEKAKKHHIINISGDECLSKYDIAIKIANKFKFDKSLIIPISIDEDTTIWKEKRPKKILLDNSLVKSILSLESLKFSLPHLN